jgi:DNA gyrase subunit B
MSDNLQYTADTIQTLSGLDYVHQRPKMFVPDLGSGGVVHMTKEYIDNSMDEFIAKRSAGVITIAVFCSDNDPSLFQIVVRDDGRGIPAQSLSDVFMKLGCSGKMGENTAYFSSSGQFGYGSKAAPGLSRCFRAISKSSIENIASSLLIVDRNVADRHDENMIIPDGVTVVFQPDVQEVFTEAVNFGSADYLDLINLCRQLNIFNPQITFKIIRCRYALPDHFWTDDVYKASMFLDKALTAETPEYDSSMIADKAEYLFSLWRIIHTPSWADQYIKMPINNDDRLGFDVRLYFCKKSATGNPQYFISLNNVALKEKNNNSITQTTLRVLREIVSGFQEDPVYQKFVLEEYNFATMLLACGVLFNGAEHSGTTKTTFLDKVFENQYYNELKQTMLAKGAEYWKELADLVQADIIQRYASYYDIPVKKSDTQRVFMDLNNPNNYYECRSTDNTKTELYIVEGTSAGGILTTRNPEYQAIYTTRGKPLNPACSPTRKAKDVSELMHNTIYQDIVRILNVTPGTRDISTCRFNKIIIATDADPDGYHIATLHIHNLYLVNALLITSGTVWIANPPLYSISYSNNKRLFLRDKHALIDAQIRFIYSKVFDFTVMYEVGGELSEVNTDVALYREMCYILTILGEQFELVANQLDVPLMILERFVYAINTLYPTINYKELIKYFDCENKDDVQVIVNEDTQTLIVSIGNKDYPISLRDVGSMITTYLLSLTKKYKYANLYFNVRVPGSNDRSGKIMTPMQVFSLLKTLSADLKISRYKGLGQMPDNSCFETLMDPTTRSITHIVDPGDVDRNYKLVGRDTVDYRKYLMAGNGSLSTAFIRSNEIMNSWNEVQ